MHQTIVWRNREATDYTRQNMQISQKNNPQRLV